MDETIEPNSGLSFDADIAAIDSLINNAAAAIDAGEHDAALDGFRQALGLARRCFGESLELTDLENTIEEIDNEL